MVLTTKEIDELLKNTSYDVIISTLLCDVNKGEIEGMIYLISLHTADEYFLSVTSRRLSHAIRTQNHPQINFFRTHMPTLFTSSLAIYTAIDSDDLDTYKMFIEEGYDGEYRTHLDMAVTRCANSILAYQISLGIPIEESLNLTLTPLIIAVNKSNLLGAKILLDSGANVNAKEGSPLINAIKYSSFEMVELLLKNGADPNPKIDNLNGEYSDLLFTAIIYNDSPVLKLLLDYGSNVSRYNEKALLTAYKHKKREMVDILLERGADFEPIKNEIIEFAINYEDTNVIQRMIELGCEISPKHLGFAIEASNLEIVKIIHSVIKEDLSWAFNLLAGAINEDNKPGSKLDICIYLFENGIGTDNDSDIISECVGTNNYRFLEYVIDKGIRTDYFRKLNVMHLLTNDVSMVKMAYLRGCDIKSEDIGRFIRMGNVSAVQYLIEESNMGFDPNLESDDYMIRAIASTSLEMVKYVESLSKNFSHEKAFYCLGLLSVFISWSKDIGEYLISHIPDVNTLYVDLATRSLVENFEVEIFGLKPQHHFQRENEDLIASYVRPIHILSELAYENNKHAIELLFKRGLDPEINGDLPLKISDKYYRAIVETLIKRAMGKPT